MEIQYLTSAHHLKVCEPHVMAIGFFDGVHLGHQQLFTKARIVAQELDIKSSVFTFSSHPNEVINGEQNRKYITPLREKMKKIATCGIDKAYVMEFDQSLASLLPFDFIKKYIIDMNVCHV